MAAWQASQAPAGWHSEPTRNAAGPAKSAPQVVSVSVVPQHLWPATPLALAAQAAEPQALAAMRQLAAPMPVPTLAVPQIALMPQPPRAVNLAAEIDSPTASTASTAPTPSSPHPPSSSANNSRLASTASTTAAPDLSAPAAVAQTPAPAAAATPEPDITWAARADHRHCPAAPYPKALRERGIEGAVILRVRVDAQGWPADVQLLAGSGYRLFDEAALLQVQRCRFQPAMRGQTALESWVEFPVRFALQQS